MCQQSTIEQLNAEQLTAAYIEAVNSYRYYANTDDISSWKNETIQREAARIKCDTYANEFLRRGLILPRIK